jgi:hypothetical protein
LFLISIMGLVVWVNFALLLAVVPRILRSVTGMENVFTLGWGGLLSSTSLAMVTLLAWLLLDPLVKVFFTLRTFHAESVATGRDILAQWRRFVAAGACLLVLLLAGGGSALAAEPAAKGAVAEAGPTSSPAAAELGARIREVLSQREYAWRLPTEDAGRKREAKGLRRWIEEFTTWIRTMQERVARVVEQLHEWLQRALGRRDSDATRGMGWDSGALLWVGGAIVLLVGGVLALRAWRRRKPMAVAPEAGLTVVPDLASADLVSSELPEDEWVALARRMEEAGEWRLAARAWFLACLAALAARSCIVPARGKSNRDYLVEVARRTGGPGVLVRCMRDGVRAFEEVWYGGHTATAEGCGRLAGVLNEVRGHGPA